MKSWVKGGIIVAVILELALFIFAYLIRPINLGVGAVPIISFPPSFVYIILVLVIGFTVGALIGKLFGRKEQMMAIPIVQK